MEATHLNQRGIRRKRRKPKQEATQQYERNLLFNMFYNISFRMNSTFFEVLSRFCWEKQPKPYSGAPFQIEMQL